jgi:hypothetical protein
VHDYDATVALSVSQSSFQHGLQTDLYDRADLTVELCMLMSEFRGASWLVSFSRGE